MSTARRVLRRLDGELTYANANTSFSPFYSDVGLGFDGGGIERLYVHYNRRTNAIGDPLVAVDRRPIDATGSPLGVSQEFDGGTADCAFYDHDAWVLELEDVQSIDVDLGLQGSAMFREEYEPFSADAAPIRETTEEGSIYAREVDGSSVLFRGYLPTLDERDPDARYPWILGMDVKRGTLGGGDGVGEPLTVEAIDGELAVAMTASPLAVDEAAIRDRLAAAPRTAADARAATRRWFEDAIDGLELAWRDGDEDVLARAVHALVFNATEAPGRLDGRVAAFPSRGDYPTHFLWDSCFQNLALEHMNEDLAPDSLLLLAENLRADGKMAHFLCSTWMRPGESQPPLVGWAARRLAEQRDAREVAEQLFEPLRANVEWWLSNRMTEYDLIGCWNPLETGWDDTPRLDEGPIVPCDMNTYLLLQIRVCAEFANRLDEPTAGEELTELADTYADRMVETLYDADANLFRGVHLESGEHLKLRTPANFLPLLADVPIPEERAEAMIADRLLDPDQFFGEVPFPVVAYDEDVYDPDSWWRGPSWPPIAYLMLEILDRHGFEEARRRGAEAFYRTIIEDGDVSELFDSRTGAGLGNDEQGWTAAIAIQLNRELY